MVRVRVGPRHSVLWQQRVHFLRTFSDRVRVKVRIEVRVRVRVRVRIRG
jgi:hypothetical protein